MKIEIPLDTVGPRNEKAVINVDGDRLTFDLYGRPWNDALGGYDDTAEMVRVHRVEFSDIEAQKIADSLRLMAG